MKKIKLLKQLCKSKVVLIKEKSKRIRMVKTEAQRDEYCNWLRENDIFYTNLSKDYRHYHIAYCLLRGRSYKQIENKIRNGNAPSFEKIEEIIKEYTDVE